MRKTSNISVSSKQCSVFSDQCSEAGGHTVCWISPLGARGSVERKSEVRSQKTEAQKKCSCYRFLTLFEMTEKCLEITNGWVSSATGTMEIADGSTQIARGQLKLAGGREKLPGEGLNLLVSTKIGSVATQTCRGTQKTIRGMVNFAGGHKKRIGGDSNLSGKGQTCREKVNHARGLCQERVSEKLKVESSKIQALSSCVLLLAANPATARLYRVAINKVGRNRSHDTIVRQQWGSLATCVLLPDSILLTKKYYNSPSRRVGTNNKTSHLSSLKLARGREPIKHLFYLILFGMRMVSPSGEMSAGQRGGRGRFANNLKLEHAYET